MNISGDFHELTVEIESEAHLGQFLLTDYFLWQVSRN